MSFLRGACEGGLIIAQTLQSWAERNGRQAAGSGTFTSAARRPTSIPERRYLEARVLDARIDEAGRQNR